MQSPDVNPAQCARARRPWSAVQHWACWLNGPDLTLLSATDFDLVVIDYSADGSRKKAFSASQIEALRHASYPRRIVSYLSIGQAESYRGYWQRRWQKAAPAWLGLPDPAWAQNYWVQYWDPAWQELIYHYLDAILAAGFDGVYLDRIDSYQERYAAGHEEDMVQFVAAIAQYTRSRASLGEDFGIIVQNAEELATRYPDYVRLVTGISREEVYIQATNKPTSSRERARVERSLNLFRQHSRGQLVLTLDYGDRVNLLRTAYKRARARGYVPYVSCVELDRLQINNGHKA